MSINKINTFTPPNNNGNSSIEMEVELKTAPRNNTNSNESSSDFSPVKEKKSWLPYSSSDSWDHSSSENSPQKKTSKKCSSSSRQLKEKNTWLPYSSSDSWDQPSPQCSPEKKTSNKQSLLISPPKKKRVWNQFSSSNSYGFSSPEGSPTKLFDEKTSPLKSLYDFLRDTDPELDLTRDNKALLEKGLKKVDELSDTPVKKMKATKAHELIELALPFSDDIFSMEYHERAHKRVKNSSWLPNTARSLSKSFDTCLHKPEGLNVTKKIMNVEHITTGEIREHLTSDGNVGGFHTVGCHFVPVESPFREKLHSVVINHTTGVFCAKFPSGNGKDKFSSFFPDSIPNQEVLLSKLFHATEIARSQNRTLCLVDNGDTSFLVMKYLQAGGFIEHSAFPIFFNAEYQEGSQFQILDNLTLSAEEVLLLAKKLGEDAVQFKINESVIGESILVVDIAPALVDRTGGISQGIFILFSEYILSFEQ